LIKFNLKPPDDESGGFFDLQICLKKRAVEPGASAQRRVFESMTSSAG
jgi:hypothetical protein